MAVRARRDVLVAGTNDVSYTRRFVENDGVHASKRSSCNCGRVHPIRKRTSQSWDMKCCLKKKCGHQFLLFTTLSISHSKKNIQSRCLTRLATKTLLVGGLGHGSDSSKTKFARRSFLNTVLQSCVAVTAFRPPCSAKATSP